MPQPNPVHSAQKTGTISPASCGDRHQRGTGRSLALLLLFCAGVSSVVCLPGGGIAHALGAPSPAQSSAAPSPAQSPAAGASAMGTVKELSGSTITLTLANGQALTVQAADGARLVQLAPGSTSLKTATPSSLSAIAVGDRVLVRGAAGASAGTLDATMVVVMKQGDIQQKQEQDLLDWQKRGTGGLVSAIDPAANTIAISTVTAAGPGKLVVDVTPKTIFRRYASDSVKFEDAKLGTFAELKPGDQMRVRGEKSEDGTAIQAEEIVSGSFLNIAGTITSINAAANTITLKDLATKKIATVDITPNSSLHKLPLMMATMFAARLHGGAAGGPGAGGAGGRGAGSMGSGAVGSSGSGAAGSGAGSSGPVARGGRGRGSDSAPSQNPAGQAGASPSGPSPNGDAAGGSRGAGGAGAGISQAIARSPIVTLADLKPGDAVMIVATPHASAAAAPTTTQPASETVTAVTVLAGVEPILAATPQNSQPMSLSAWTMGGDVPSQ